MPARIAILVSLHPDSKAQAQSALEKCSYLRSHGLQSDLYLVDAGDDSSVVHNESSRDADQLKEYSQDIFNEIVGPETSGICPIYRGHAIRGTYDLVLYFGWRAARLVGDVQAGRQALVVSDIEAWRYPMGDTFVAAENALQCGLDGIALGRWVGRTLQKVFGIRSFVCELGVDAIARPGQDFDRNGVCAIWEPKQAPTCTNIVGEALGILVSRRPEHSVVFVGSEEAPKFRYRHDNVTNPTKAARHQVYQSSVVGLCLTTTSDPRSALEMMACGLPVVNLFREVNLYDYPSEGTLLAYPTAESIALALEVLVDSADLLAVERLDEVMARRTRSQENNAFDGFVRRLLDGESPSGDDASQVEPLYRSDPIVSPYNRTPQVAYRMWRAGHVRPRYIVRNAIESL